MEGPQVSEIPDTPSVAVLKLHHFGEADATLASAFGRDLATGLARARWLTIAAPYSSLRYLLHGTLALSAGRCTLELVMSDALANTLVMSSRVERRGIDLSLLMEDISAEVVASVEWEIEAEQRRRAELSPVRSLDAWSGFHRGMTLVQSYRPDRVDEIDATLRQAARSDPACARVAAARSYLTWQRVFLNVSNSWEADVHRCREQAMQSITLDPHDPFGHWGLGRAAMLDMDPETAVESFGTSVEMNPSDAVGHYSLGHSLRMLGRDKDAMVHSERALRLSPIDPLSYAFRVLDAGLHVFFGDRERARAQVRRAALHPNAHPYVFAAVGWMHEICGDRTEALRYIQRVRRMSPDYSREEVPCSLQDPEPLAGGEARNRSGF